MKFVQSTNSQYDDKITYLFCIVRGKRAYEKGNSWWAYPSEGYLTDFELEFVIQPEYPTHPSDDIPF